MILNRKLKKDGSDIPLGFVKIKRDNITGIGQQSDQLVFLSHMDYIFKMWAGSNRAGSIKVVIKSRYFKVFYETEIQIPENAPHYAERRFAIMPSVTDCVLEITWDDAMQPAIQALSLTESDSYHGMRRDVLDKLKELRPGNLRFPGGCLAEYYDWKDGLLPPHERKGVYLTELPFVLPQTFGTDPHDVGIDEFIMACRYVGAKPQITVRLSDNEPSDAADFVEYCNGSADTKWGRLRISRGFAEPHGVNVWYIGNELAGFGRNGMNAAGKLAAERTGKFVAAMKAADPKIKTVASAWVNADGSFNQWSDDFVKAQNRCDIVSVHNYLSDYSAIYGDTNIKDADDIQKIVDAPFDYLLPHLQKAKERLNAKFISFDEWNYLWDRYGSAFTGIYAAGVLHMLVKNKEKLGLDHACYFHPLNESAIRIIRAKAELAPDGIVFKYLSMHTGGIILEDKYSADKLDVLQTEHTTKGETITSIINRDVYNAHENPIKTVKEGGRYISISPQNGDIRHSDFRVCESDKPIDIVSPMSMLVIICKTTKNT
jgi:alpha-N-arabinofuranosidase